MNNLKYGLVGNTIFYGGVWGFIGYLGWELINIGEKVTKVDDDHPAQKLFKENQKKKNQLKKQYTDEEIRKMAIQEHLNPQKEQIIKKLPIVDDQKADI